MTRPFNLASFDDSLEPPPADFDEVFVEIGRVACEARYNARRTKIDRWLIERGKQRLIAKRAAFVRNGRRQGITRRDMQQILSVAFPPPDRKQISFALARRAAHYLRVHRNGGWIVSPAPNGMWFVGARKRTAHELVELAKAKGFQANLSDDSDVG